MTDQPAVSNSVYLYAKKRAAKHDSDNLGVNEKVVEITLRHFHVTLL